jgi:hypothetical protein
LNLRLGRQVLSEAVTSPTGAYTLTAPVNQPFVVQMAADQHRAVESIIQVGDSPTETGLQGGDLNGDGCIGVVDLGLVTVSFEQPDLIKTDITGDGITDASDLVILASNYTPDCDSPVETATPTPQATSDSATPLPVETTAEGTVEPSSTVDF